MGPASKNKAFQRASVFMHELYACGIRHLVISPGSRSTPLTLASAIHSGLAKYVILDERSAGFTALGIGKSTGMPAALICTSGTAVANYLPAVIEARQSAVPLILLTADRPPYLRNTGANQTINQVEIFGEYPVFFHDLGEPVVNESDPGRLEKIAQLAVETSLVEKGPVHLNFPFEKPLEPDTEFINQLSIEHEEQERRIIETPEEEYHLPEQVLHAIGESIRPLIIVGQLAPHSSLGSIFELADLLKAPVISEQGRIDSINDIQGFEGFLRNTETRERLAPDLIVRFGLQPASKSLLTAVKEWDTRHHIYFSDTGRKVDISFKTDRFKNWTGNPFSKDALPQNTEETWLNQWKDVEEAYFKKLWAALGDTSVLTDGHVFSEIAPKIPEDWFIFISNSFPARDQSMLTKWNTQTIYTNRGASGIDGITSTTMGIGIGADQPGILFTGDLSFLHDTNALLNHRQLTRPLVVVVVNNKGGTIFRMLPVAEHASYFKTYFETPQEVEISALAKSYGIPCQKIETVEQLQTLNLKQITGHSESELCIVECITDSDASMKLRYTLWELSV